MLLRLSVALKRLEVRVRKVLLRFRRQRQGYSLENEGLFSTYDCTVSIYILREGIEEKWVVVHMNAGRRLKVDARIGFCCAQ